MLSAAGVQSVILLAAEAAAQPPSWWEVTSGLLLAGAGVYATWAQFVYPKILERRGRADVERPGMVPAGPPAVDPIVFAVRQQSEQIEGLHDDLARANRLITRQAGTIARLEAERAAARCPVCGAPLIT